MVVTDGEKESGVSVLSAQLDKNAKKIYVVGWLQQLHWGAGEGTTSFPEFLHLPLICTL